MSNTLLKMLARTGKSPSDFSKHSNLGKLFRQNGVPKSPDLARILNIPRRSFEMPDDSFTKEVTEFFKKPNGTMTLRPIQALALKEMHDFGGLFAPVRVGAGKTLLSLLAPTVLESKRALLLIPAKLRNKTKLDLDLLAQHWQINETRIRIESYEMVSRAQKLKECDVKGCVCAEFDGKNTCSCGHDVSDHASPSILEEYGPDLLILDECHRAKNLRAAVTRKIRRYMQQNPKTRFVALSGTIAKRSLKDYAHILEWCFPRHAPVPRSYSDLVDWANCLDEKVDPLVRLAPGALVALMNDEERHLMQDKRRETEAARLAYRRRLVETPGVVATSDKFLGASLSIEVVTNIPLHSKIESAFAHMRQFWETPDGHPIAEESAMWRHARELACGFYYVWNPRPPQAWLDARREWASFVRDVIAHNRTGLDSELQVARQHKNAPELLAWQAVRDTFQPNVEPVWLDRTVLERAAAWMRENRGIVWVEHRAVGQELAKIAGASFFSDGGCDENGVPIEKADPDRSFIASIASNGEGRNLQAWSDNLVVSAPPTGIVWEQMLGRCHRDGQQSDEVSFTVYALCLEAWNGLMQAKRDAKFLYESLGQEQKLLHADWIAPTQKEIDSYAHDSARWQKPEQQ